MIHHIDKENNFIKQNIDYKNHELISAQTKILASKFYNEISNYFSKVNGNFLEIGTFNGQGARELALKFSNKKIYVIDSFIEDGNTGYIVGCELSSQKYNALKNFENVDNIELFEMRSNIFKERWIKKVENIDIMFIDGSHIYEDVKNDIEIVDKILNVGGYVFIDDYHISDVKKACIEFFEYNNNYNQLETSTFERKG